MMGGSGKKVLVVEVASVLFGNLKVRNLRVCVCMHLNALFGTTRTVC